MNELKDYFGVSEAIDLVLLPIVVNVRLLQVVYDGTQAMFHSELGSFISGVGEANETSMLWLTNPLMFAFNTATHGFDAALRCGAILCDPSGFKLVFDDDPESRKLTVLPEMDIGVLLRKVNSASPT